MDRPLTVDDLRLPGEPLDPSELVAGDSGVGHPITWVVSLRPFPPAFPRLRGGELALIVTDYLARLDPPATLADVVRYLALRDVSAVAVRGDIDVAAEQVANDQAIPLLKLAADAPMHDIEHAVMRECALYQARREVAPLEEPAAWLEDLLAGRTETVAEAQAAARRQGQALAPSYSVAYLEPTGDDEGYSDGSRNAIQALEVELSSPDYTPGNQPVALAIQYIGGLAVLLPQGKEDRLREVLARFPSNGLACGIGTERPVLEVSDSLSEAQLAAQASALLRGGAPVSYSSMGLDRLLVILHGEYYDDLQSFVRETLGPLLDHDAASSVPLLPTLRAFMEHGSHLRDTAESLFVHRNTLAYRLERISYILGVDLKDSTVRLSIELALSALPLVVPARGG